MVTFVGLVLSSLGIILMLVGAWGEWELYKIWGFLMVALIPFAIIGIKFWGE